MFVIGLTGGIGSGKSAVSDRFAQHGITIVDADVASRVVVEPGRPALTRIAEHFGAELITSSGTLDRALLRSKVFSSEQERKWLEALLHPLIAEEIQSGLANSRSPYTVLVSPLLLETTQHSYVDRILVVDVPVELQLHRTMARDNNSESQVRAIIAAQMARDTRRSRADDLISNDGSLEQLQQQVDALHQRYLALAAAKAAGAPA
ncbi:MAG TPA: dephospho-CoA kinase [Pseudomonadales bacterium]|nr:dephospho-CoA kinase [Pseudomonadales bacterium]